MVDKKELEAKSKSAFGKFTPTPQKPFMAFLGKFITSNSTSKSYINGVISAAVLLYWWFQKDSNRWAFWPLGIWLCLCVASVILGLFYWASEKKRLEIDIQRCEKEIQQIGAEINDRKQYFEKIRDEIAKNNQN